MTKTNSSRPVSAVKVVALIGPAQAGKTTAATRLISCYQHTRFRFADTLKNMMGTLGCTREQIDGAEKEVPLDFLCDKTCRFAMQTIGTEWGRKLIGMDLWAVQTAYRIEEGDAVLVVVDDGRFPNEVGILKERFDTTVIRVWNSAKRYPYFKMWLARRAWGRAVARVIPFLYIHESEAWWPVLPVDAEIDNSGTLDDLYGRINELMAGRAQTATKTRLKYASRTRVGATT